MVPLPRGRLSGLRPLEPPRHSTATQKQGIYSRIFADKGRGKFRFCERAGEGVGCTPMTEAAQEQGVNFPAHYGKKNGASDRIRTGDNHVGNVMLYQLSYTRLFCSNNIAYIFILSSPKTNFF